MKQEAAECANEIAMILHWASTFREAVYVNALGVESRVGSTSFAGRENNVFL